MTYAKQKKRVPTNLELTNDNQTSSSITNGDVGQALSDKWLHSPTAFTLLLVGS